MTIRKSVVLVGSSNGSDNYGDDMMWLATANALRQKVPEVPIVTDSTRGWLPPVGGVITLPFMHNSLLRFNMKVTGSPLANKAQAAVGLAMNRDAVARGLQRQEELAAGANPLGLEQRWDSVISSSQGLVISGAGGLTDTFSLHAVAGWGMMVALAHRHGVPVAMLGQGVGPLRDSELRNALRSTLARCDLITTRDAVSRREVLDLVPDANVQTHIDWAVLEDPSGPTQAAVDEYLRARDIGSFVAVSLHDWRPAAAVARNQVGALLNTVARVSRGTGCDVVMVPNSVGIQRSDDKAFMARAATGLPAELQDRVHRLPERMTAFETRALLRRSSGVFASRYHPSVFALAAGRPSTGIAYDDYYIQKHRGALSWYGEEDRVHRLSESHTDDWWESGIDVGGHTARRRLDVTDCLRRKCVAPFYEWLERWKVR